MTTTKLEFVNRDCGLVAEAELLGGKWYIDVRTDAPLNMLAKENEADVLEWALQHGFKQRREPRFHTATGKPVRFRKPGEPMRVKMQPLNEEEGDEYAAQFAEFPRRDKPWPDMCK